LKPLVSEHKVLIKAHVSSEIVIPIVFRGFAGKGRLAQLD
jgi:hypothetical protein